jgi:hypothetical protein
MSRKHPTRGASQLEHERGSAMMEFIFTVPVLLMIAGTTVDIARYMRYLQITSFVSQEAASQIYRQCSDITVYTKPRLGTTTVTPHTSQTIMAIERCLERVQIQSQNMLNVSLGRAAMSAQVFRWQINQTTVTSDCSQASNPNTQDPVTVISTTGGLNPSVTTNADGPHYYDYQEKDSTSYSRVVNRNTLKIVVSSDSPKTNTTLSAESETAVTTPRVVYRDNQLLLTFPADSGRPSRPITSREGLCTRGRVATVEVGFVFDPVVKFLPNLITKLETNALNREVSVF